MSQVATFVRCDDGLWYKSPVWYDTFGGHDWFICFDDDDPPEIVIAGAASRVATLNLTEQILNGFGRQFKLVRPGITSGKCKRMFPPKWEIKAMKYASSWFFQWEEAPPKPRLPAEATPEAEINGVMYPYDGPRPNRGVFIPLIGGRGGAT